MSPDWPKLCTPRQAIGAPAAPARKASVCGWPSTSVTIGTRRPNSRSIVARVALAEARAGLEGAEQQVGARDADHLGGDARLLGEHVGRLDRLGHERAHDGDRHARLLGCAQPVAPGERLLARARVQPLVDRPRREPEVRGAAALAAEPRQRVQERPLEVLAEGGLPRDAARLLDPDRGRDHRLVRAALGPERDAARRADEDRLAARVDPERPRLQRARDERVVDRADRQQRLAVARPRRAELAQQPDEVDLGDAELDVPAVVELSRQRTSVSVSSANQSIRSPGAQMPALLIQPPRLVEVPTSGETVTTRPATSGASRTRSTKKRPNACWVDSVALVLAARGRPARRAGRPRASGPAAPGAGPSPRTAPPRASRRRTAPTGPRDRCRASAPARRTARRSAAPSGWPGGPPSAASSP